MLRITSKQRGCVIIKKLFPERVEEPVVCYSETESVKVLNSSPEEEILFKKIAYRCIRDSILVNIHQKKYSVLFVNNFNTMHGRTAFAGSRSAIRLRVDDPSFK